MKSIFLTILIVSNMNLFGFDIQSVDLTTEGKKKSALPYTIAKDGKKIYKDIGKTINALHNKSIVPMEVKIIYPIGSNKTYKFSSKKRKIEAKEDNVTSVFTNVDINITSHTEVINEENQKIKLKSEARKIIPVNLEKE